MKTLAHAALALPTHISLAHGGGGQLTDDLIRDTILPRIGNDTLNELMDSAILDVPAGHRIAFSVDGYVVHPTCFPGGDVGRLAICGTVNDLAVVGGRPAGIALGVIAEEGCRRDLLERVLDSAGEAAREAGVFVVTGDTKVVGRGAGDGIYLTSAGVGFVPHGRNLRAARVQPGDAILINGPIADHGLSVMLAREMPELESAIESDAAPLNHLIEDLLSELRDDVVFLRDPTRSGLAGVGADLAVACGHRVVFEEERIPVRPSTRHAANLLGLDPLEVANEGKVVAVVRATASDHALAVWREHPRGREACLIGHVESVPAQMPPRCELFTRIGGRRLLAKPYGEQLPRIC